LKVFGKSGLLVACGVLIGIGVGSQLPIFRSQQKPEFFRLADGSNTIGALIFLAHNQAYFEEENLHAVRVPFITGRDALASLVEGKVDVATVADTPIVIAASKNEKFSIIATVASSQKHSGIIVDRSVVEEPKDLIGKKIGVTPNTSSEYFLETFLIHNAIPLGKVVPVEMEPRDVSSMLSSKKVAAVSAWNPALGDAKDAMGDAAKIFHSDFYTFTWNVVVSPAFARDTEKCRKIIRALLKAEKFYNSNNDEAKIMVANYMRMSRHTLDSALDVTKVSVTLDQSLIPTLESQARWYREKRSHSDAPVPNFLNYILLDPLVLEAPERVSIIR
jgi:ABC-type nitrate/sulfonate/bicarbonate transport system substrate-binding protein